MDELKEEDFQAMDELVAEIEIPYEAFNLIRSVTGLSLTECRYYFEARICTKYKDAECVKRYLALRAL